MSSSRSHPHDFSADFILTISAISSTFAGSGLSSSHRSSKTPNLGAGGCSCGVVHRLVTGAFVPNTSKDKGNKHSHNELTPKMEYLNPTHIVDHDREELEDDMDEEENENEQIRPGASSAHSTVNGL